MEQSKNSLISSAFRSALDDAARRARADKISITCKYLYPLLLLCIAGSMIPYPHLNMLASALAFGLIGALLALRKGLLLRKSLLALVCLSLLAGCSPFFASDNLSPAEFDICTESGSCKTGYVQGFALLGFGLDDVSVESAKFNGLITRVMGIERSRGYGLISVAKVRVVGE